MGINKILKYIPNFKFQKNLFKFQRKFPACIILTFPPFKPPN